MRIAVEAYGKLTFGASYRGYIRSMAAPAELPLRAITYLSPSIPLEFYQQITRYLGKALGRTPLLESDERVSGPMHGSHDPFAAGRSHLGFLCSPSFLYLRAQAEPSVELVPVGLVFRDARNLGRPHYFSDVIVRADRGPARLEDLRGAVFGFNDTCSLSGFFAAHQELSARDRTAGFFGEERCTGSHEASIQAVLTGDIDVAAIDSNVLALARRTDPSLCGRLRVVESWGPHPIQPVVVSTRLVPGLGARLRSALLTMMGDPEVAPNLSRFGLERCVPIDDSLYEAERAALVELGELRSHPGSSGHGRSVADGTGLAQRENVTCSALVELNAAPAQGPSGFR